MLQMPSSRRRGSGDPDIRGVLKPAPDRGNVGTRSADRSDSGISSSAAAAPTATAASATVGSLSLVSATTAPSSSSSSSHAAGVVIRKPLQVLCFLCCREYGTQSLRIAESA